MRITATALVFPLTTLAAPIYGSCAAAVQTVDALMKANGKKYFGVATDKGRLSSGQNAAIVQTHFGQVTPENSMKWASTEPTQGNFTFADSDWLVTWALNNNKTIRGHTFLWHGQLADWVSKIRDKAQMQKALENHITTVMTRYKGWIRAYDVANEVFNEDGTLRSSPFYDVLGEDMISIAFNAAHKADPGAILYINDYNLNNPNASKLTAGMVAHVKKWRAQGIPVMGIGTQGHIGAGEGPALAGAIKALGASGVNEVAVTELDIAGAGPGNNVNDYAAVAQGCVAVKNCAGITAWGVRDQDSWLGPNKNALLFDDNWLPKASYQAVARTLRTLAAARV